MRMKNKRYLLLLLMVLPSMGLLRAQDDTQLSQYWAMPSYYNAGAAGIYEKLNLRAATRQQWVGMPGAPKSFLALADMPLRFLKADHGVGLMLANDSYGLFKTTSLGLQYAYKVRLWGGQLSLGLQLGLVSQTFDGTEVFIPESDYHQQTDNAIPTTELQGTAFDVGFGMYYTLKYFYAGLSSTHLTQPTISFDEAELTLRLKYNRFIWGGLAYRWKEAVIFMAGCEFKNFLLGYSYDYSTSAIQKASSGSHEVFVGYSMKLELSKGKKNKHKSIRIL